MSSSVFYYSVLNSMFDVIDNIVAHCSSVLKMEYVSKLRRRFSPVSYYDKLIEAKLRFIIGLVSPDSGVYGEEYKIERLNNKNMWVIDPIDGTKSFICGSPIWGTVIGILRDGCLSVGGVNYSVLKERLIGINRKTFYITEYGSSEIKARKFQRNLNEYIISTSSLGIMNLDEMKQFKKLYTIVRHTILNYDCYAYILLLKGYIDAILECHLKPYDFLGLVPVLRNAGLLISNWQGKSVIYSSKVLVCSSVEVKNNIVRILNAN